MLSNVNGHVFLFMIEPSNLSMKLNTHLNLSGFFSSQGYKLSIFGLYSYVWRLLVNSLFFRPARNIDHLEKSPFRGPAHRPWGPQRSFACDGTISKRTLAWRFASCATKRISSMWPSPVTIHHKFRLTRWIEPKICDSLVFLCVKWPNIWVGSCSLIWSPVRKIYFSFVL